MIDNTETRERFAKRSEKHDSELGDELMKCLWIAELIKTALVVALGLMSDN